MAKATTTIRQVLNLQRGHGYQADYGAWFAANQDLFNRATSFYFGVIQAHEEILDLENQDALTALEKLTHTTQRNPNPVMQLSEIQENIPAMFRRAAIHTALGSARSFYSTLGKWHKRKEKAIAKGKKFTERPPVPPRTWNKSATLYAGQWKERAGSSIMLKVWTGSVWSWIKVRITGREIPDGVETRSPQLIRKGNQWRLHTPIEKQVQESCKDRETSHY
jgi:putative transposase